MDIREMKPECSVGLGGAPSAIEKLWQYVYDLKERLESVEADNQELLRMHGINRPMKG